MSKFICKLFGHKFVKDEFEKRLLKALSLKRTSEWCLRCGERVEL